MSYKTSGKVLEMNKANALGEWITRQLGARDMSLSEFARKSGVSKPTLSRLINGGIVNWIRDDTLYKLASFTNTNPGDLFAMVRPNSYDRASAELLIAREIAALSEDERAVVLDLIASIKARKKRKNAG